MFKLFNPMKNNSNIMKEEKTMNNRNRRGIRKTAAMLALCAALAAAPVIPNNPMGNFAATASAASAQCSIADLQRMYPDGSHIYEYAHGNSMCWECVAGAYTLGETVSGESPYSWKMLTDKNEIAEYINSGKLKPTDIVRFGTEASGHTFFVTGVYGNNITFMDCNGGNEYCSVRWGGGAVVSGSQGFFTDSPLSSAYGVTTIDYIRVSPVENVSNYEGFRTPGLAFAKTFDSEYYRKKYSDLNAAFGSNSAKLAQHFLRYGAAEGRSPSKSYNSDAYYSRYDDLRRAFGSDRKALFNHYITYGYYENRNAKSNAASSVISNNSAVTISINNVHLNLYANAHYNGGRIVSWVKDGSTEQIFVIKKTGSPSNTYYITCGGYSVDVLRNNGRIREYSRVDIWQTGTDPEAQEWLIQKVGNKYAIKLASNPSLCLTMMSTSNNVDFAVTKYSKASNQLFEINFA